MTPHKLHPRKGPTSSLYLEKLSKHSAVLLCADPANPYSAKRMAEELEATGLRVTIIHDYEQCLLGGKAGIINLLGKHQALAIMGNDAYDVAPPRYKKRTHHDTISEHSTSTARDRARVESVLLQAAYDRHLPMLGICGGMQEMAVEFGGELYQDLGHVLGHNHHQQSRKNIPDDLPSHAVELTPGSVFAAIMDQPQGGSVDFNSRHHQAIRILPKIFKIAAYTPEKNPNGHRFKIIEAIESADMENRWMLGIQSHPELLADRSKIKAIAGAFHSAVQKRASVLLHEAKQRGPLEFATRGERAAAR